MEHYSLIKTFSGTTTKRFEIVTYLLVSHADSKI